MPRRPNISYITPASKDRASRNKFVPPTISNPAPVNIISILFEAIASLFRVSACQTKSRRALEPMWAATVETAQGPRTFSIFLAFSESVSAKPSRSPGRPKNLPNDLRATIPLETEVTALGVGSKSAKASSTTRKPPLPKRLSESSSKVGWEIFDHRDCLGKLKQQHRN